MFEIDGVRLLFNGKAIYEAIDEIYEIIISDQDTAVIKYFSLDYADKKGYMKSLREFWPDITDEEDFKIINQNVLCVDKNGNEVWRIEAPHLLDRRADSFIYVSFDDAKNRWEGTTHFGHECVVDINTGKLSDIRHYATK